MVSSPGGMWCHHQVGCGVITRWDVVSSPGGMWCHHHTQSFTRWDVVSSSHPVLHQVGCGVITRWDVVSSPGGMWCHHQVGCGVITRWDVMSSPHPALLTVRLKPATLELCQSYLPTWFQQAENIDCITEPGTHHPEPRVFPQQPELSSPALDNCTAEDALNHPEPRVFPQLLEPLYRPSTTLQGPDPLSLQLDSCPLTSCPWTEMNHRRPSAIQCRHRASWSHAP